MPRPAIVIYGALARFNYGDLLFPLILERAFRGRDPTARVTAVGLRRSDMSGFGAMPTRDLRWLANPDNIPAGSSVIIAGGEALAADWTRLAGHLLPERYGDAMFAAASRLLPGSLLESLARRRVKAPWPIPFAPRPSHFGGRARTIFNAVGGTGLSERAQWWRREVMAAVGEASFASVRDATTLEALGGADSPARLIPDSAAVMAMEFPRAHLQARAGDETRRILDGDRPFLCFQLHRYFSGKKLRTFAAELDELHSSLGLDIVLLPIGRAAGHSDRIALRKLRSMMRCPAHLPGDIHLREIMALLAHCAVYAGTSLHGLISAMAYARPFAILGKSPKCRSYAETWAIRELQAPLQARGFGIAIADRLRTPDDKLERCAAEVAARAAEGLDRVADAVLND